MKRSQEEEHNLDDNHGDVGVGKAFDFLPGKKGLHQKPSVIFFFFLVWEDWNIFVNMCEREGTRVAEWQGCQPAETARLTFKTDQA